MPDIYLHLNGQQAGPYQPAQLRQLLAEGKVSNDALAWHKDLAAWSTVAQVLAQFPEPGMPVPPTPALPPMPPPPPPKKGLSGCMIAAIVVGAIGIFVLPCCAGIALGPITNGIHKAKENMAMLTSRQIGLAMFAYATDHNGAYPDGKTSTEVFQKLLDEKYVSDPAIFYLAMSGKTKATSSKLTAENVCFDVTSGVTSDSSADLPVVFCTGYTVTYAPGSSATRDSSASTPFPGPNRGFRGLAVTYKGNNARFLNAAADGTVADFIPESFDPAGKTYRQLKP